MPRILHFADAHIDIANYGRRDPETGLPLRFLGVGEGLDDLQPFDPEAFVAAILD